MRLIEGVTFDEAGLKEWADERLSDYKVPQRIIAVDDLPRTGTNKVQRRDVKIGEVNDQGASIVSGLSGSEAVVASAGAFLNPGDKIIPTRGTARP